MQKSLINKVLGNITTSTDVTNAVLKADLVIEAIIENVEIKRQLLKEIESSSPEYAIFRNFIKLNLLI